MKPYQLTIALCSVFLAPVTVFAQTQPRATDLTTNPVFQRNCAKCHGRTAEGHRFGGPSLVSPKTTGTPADKLREIIANGKGHMPKFRMPKFGDKLTSEEIDMLVRQIQRAHQGTSARSPVVPDGVEAGTVNSVASAEALPMFRSTGRLLP